ncbi:transposase [Candidatus Poribacteria bacterium]|nr:transposase [Candidatus Poribacteria bacterium]
MLIADSFFRRNLPHWQPLGVPFFLTYRLAGTLPGNVLNELEKKRQWMQALPRKPQYSEKQWSMHIEKKLFTFWDEYLDRDTNIQWLANPRIATIVRDNLYHHTGTKYSLWAYVIMPNHVHLLLKPDEVWEKRFEVEESGMAQYEKGPLSAILHSLRSYTAHEANKILGRSGKFWQREAFDHWVRDNAEFERIIYYIENNPVRARLVSHPEDWHFSSASDRTQRELGAFDKLA